jgi:hypothetical protein
MIFFIKCNILKLGGNKFFKKYVNINILLYYLFTNLIRYTVYTYFLIIKIKLHS